MMVFVSNLLEEYMGFDSASLFSQKGGNFIRPEVVF